jgi:site-specific recombinase XerD
MQITQAVESFLLSMSGGVKSPATIKWYRKRLASLADFIGEVETSAISIHDLRRWRVSLSERSTRYVNHPSGRASEPGGLSPHTLHGYVRAAKRLFVWLEDEGLIEKNQARRLELPKLPRGTVKGIEHEDLRAMLTAAKSISKRELALVWFFYSTAARAAGVVGLRMVDLNLDRGIAYVTEKGNKTRPVLLIREAVSALVDWLAIRPATGDPHVFLGLRGPLKYSGVYQVLERVAKKAGVKHGWNPHNWRHRRLRDLQELNVSLGIVSQIAGHSSEEITADIYGRVPESALKKVVDTLPLPFDLPDDMVSSGES